METIHCKNRDEWRSWLAQNHKSSDGIWLIYYKKHTKKETVVYNEAVEEALCFGWIDSLIKRIDDQTYMQKYTPRKKNSKWSLVNKKRVEKLIDQGKMTKAGMQEVELARKNGTWDKAYSAKREVKVPDFFKEELQKNKQAYTNFYNFAQSYQNQYLGWILSAKRDETKQKRIQIVIQRCANNQKPGMV
ncbi:MAG: YdeI/OmpD-associated family protein [Bacteroidetes bacterium]|nr:YdeI/OmpD-associated family protein [Bacteroidota bacterium]